jgi:hypothetical protein
MRLHTLLPIAALALTPWLKPAFAADATVPVRTAGAAAGRVGAPAATPGPAPRPQPAAAPDGATLDLRDPEFARKSAAAYRAWLAASVARKP